MGFSTSQMASTSLALQSAGAASSTVGAYYTAQGQKDNLSTQAYIAEQNARISEVAAQSALMRGQREEQRSRLKTAQIKGSQRAAMAANGIDLSSATPQEILAQTELMGEVDANTIAANAIQSAWGYRTESSNLLNEADMNRASASGINPYVSASNTLLGSGAQVASSWYSFKKDKDGVS